MCVVVAIVDMCQANNMIDANLSYGREVTNGHMPYTVNFCFHITILTVLVIVTHMLQIDIIGKEQDLYLNSSCYIYHYFSHSPSYKCICQAIFLFITSDIFDKDCKSRDFK